MGGRMIKRHTKLSIYLHWFNAFCWIFLLATGLGLVNNPSLQPLGQWWTDFMWRLFGSGQALLIAHSICGVLWSAVFLIYGIGWARKETIPFIKEIFTFNPTRDFMWLVKKGIQMTLGFKAMAKLGFDTRLPDQGFYNVGQKLFAVPSVLGGIVIGITGFIMLFSRIYISNMAIVQWAILIHFVTVGLVFAGLLIHIFMASIASGERPAFISMFTGTVPESYAIHHHKLWHDEIQGREVQDSV